MKEKKKKKTHENEAGEGEPEVLVGDDFKATGLELDKLDDTSDDEVNDDKTDDAIIVGVAMQKGGFCFGMQQRKTR